MNKRYGAMAALAVLMAGTGLAHADDAAQKPGWYAGLQVGSMRKADLITGDTDAYLGFLAGYRFNKEWSAELTAAGGFSCDLHIMGNLFGDRCEALDRHIGGYGLYTLPATGDLKLYGRLGLGNTRVQTFDGKFFGSYSRVEAGVGGGLAYEPWSSMSVRFDVNHLTRTKATSMSLQLLWRF